MRFRILGSLEVRSSDGTPVRIGAPKVRALLAVLLLHANQPVSIDRLAAVLWLRRPPRSAVAAVRTYVSDLRRLLQLGPPGLPRLVAEPGGYQLRLGVMDLDASVFEELAIAGKEALAGDDPMTAAERLRQALALWRGRPLEDVPLEGDDSAVQLARLDEQRLDVVETWADAQLTLGRHSEVAAGLAGVAAEQPLRERLWELRMLALYGAGRQADALATYRELRQCLADELGIEPSQPLQRLHQRILVADLEPPVPASTGQPVPCQLPADIGSFTGRARELAGLSAVLLPDAEPGRPVVVAVDGPGGVGKSALVVHAAHRFAHRFPDGQLYANLFGTAAGPAPAQPLVVLGRFLRALGVAAREIPTEEDEAAEQFRAVASGRRLLVVLDDAANAVQVRALVPNSPSCSVLVTSRSVLATIDGAHHVHLGPFSTEEAVALLGHLAGEQRVAADIEAVRRTVRFCGHLPLAVRIAGARLAARPSWPPGELATRLASAQRRLDELQIADLGVRASFQVSHQQLVASTDPVDRAAATAFPLLGLPDGADIDRRAAARLLDRGEAETARCLERLVDAQVLETPTPGRYRLHELMRLFARELASDSHSAQAAVTRLLTWYLATVWQTYRLLVPGGVRFETPSENGLHFTDAAEAVAWLEAERTNLVAAVAQAATTDARISAGLARGLFGFFAVRGHWSDWTQVNETALVAAVRAGHPADEAYACLDLGIVCDLRGDYAQALVRFNRARRLFEMLSDRHGEAACLTALGVVNVRLEQPADALAYLEAGLSIRRALGDQHGQAVSLGNLGELHLRQGRHRDALVCHRAALAIFGRLAEHRGMAHTLHNLGQLRREQGRWTEAANLLTEGLEVFGQLGDDNGRAGVLCDLGCLHHARGRRAQALACFEEAAAVFRRLGNRHAHADCCRKLGVTLRALGRPAEAGFQWRRALAELEELGLPAAEEVRTLLRELGGAVPARC